MRATISWWDLSRSTQTIDTLRKYLANDGVRPWERVEGLLLKFWISDRKTNRWGAVMLLSSSANSNTKMPPNKATELIGYPPTVRVATDIEALVGGVQSGHLVDRGLAYEPEGFQI